MQTTVLKVTGMKCERCTAKVEAVLVALAGVNEAKAVQESGEVSVTHNDDVLLEDISVAVREAGFEVLP
ncbi:MAG: cation transporter [Coriobacteriales bacterium]|jgi:copper chaperone CopZ|nr:cation transporter [Coriobacteriales bacterium]